MPNIALAAARKVSAAGPPASVVEIAAGFDYVLARKSDNTNWAWGDGAQGGLGINSSARVNVTPTLIVGGYSFCEITAGFYASAGVQTSNQLGFSWGYDLFGGGGRGTPGTDVSSPAAITGGYSYSKITVGLAIVNMGAITTGGTAYSWGINNSGQLGDNTITNKCSPVAVCCAFCYCDIAVGSANMVALDYLGAAWGWGLRTFGRLGVPVTPTSTLTPVAATAAADGNTSYSRITAGNGYTLAISAAGTGYGWGLNSSGQLGDNTTVSKTSPVLVCGGLIFCRIAAGTNHTVALTTGGTAYAWGNNGNGYLGLNDLVNRATPTSVCTTLQFCEIAAGNSNTVAISYDGKVYTWGTNRYGQLGNGLFSQASTPCNITTIVASYIGVGLNASGAISTGGTAFSWGLGTDGAIGNNTSTSPGAYDVPTQVCGATALAGITMGDNFTITWTSGGTAYGWGGNANGYLGDNSITSKSTPVAVCGAGLSFCKISAKSRFVLALTHGGTGYSWGNNQFGQLGVLGTVCYSTPQIFHTSGRFSYCDISAGYNHSLAVRDDGGGTGGTGYSWGNNANGQLGDNNTLSKQTPAVILVRKFCRVAASSSFSVGITEGGTMVAWGINSSGQLGDNSVTSRRTPVAVCGLTGLQFCDLAAGASHVVALTTGGTAWAWGGNQFGQLGDSTVVGKSNAVAVCHAGINFVSVAAHNSMTMAITSGGTVYTWGDGVNGNLGRGNGIALTPVSVVNL